MEVIEILSDKHEQITEGQVKEDSQHYWHLGSTLLMAREKKME